MTVKTLKRSKVAFYTTSDRLSEACRNAAKRSKQLGRVAELLDLSRAVSRRIRHERRDTLQKVVLSHVDDDYGLLTDPRLESVIAESFHLLFTEPSTHPDQVAQWMRATNIRSENRLHVVCVDSLESPGLSQLLARVSLSLTQDASCEEYGAAIRRVREEAGIAQSEVQGLTDRQLRRVEQGECRATSAAIGALAKAHGLAIEDYLERLADALK